MKKIKLQNTNSVLILASTVLSLHALAFEVPERREFPTNTAIDPCTNFYEYACSNVNKSFTLPEDRSRHTFSFSDPAERILEFKKKYFLKLATAKPTSERERQLKNYYQACMNEPERANEERALVKSTIAKLEKIKTKEELIQFFSDQITQPDAGLITFDTDNNQDRPTWYDISFDTPLLSLPDKSYYEKNDVVAALEQLQVQFYKTIGASDPEKKAKLRIQFEKDLAKTYPSKVDFRNLYSTRTGITKEELVKKYPNLHLTQFLAQIPDHTHIRHFIPASMEFLNEKLDQISVEDFKTIYLYGILAGYLDDAFPEYFNQSFQFRNKFLGGPAARPVRQERCTKTVMNNFPKEIDSILWPRFFPNFPKKKIVSVAEKIRASILTMLKENTWLSAGAKSEAIKKISTARLQLVAPLNDVEWDFNPKESYSAKAPLQNSKTLVAALIKKNLADLRTEMSKDRWSMGPMTINAYYNPSYNKFVLPVGILQYPFFDGKMSEELNLAAIGTVIGHELGHSIDDKGSKFNADGMLVTWMKDADLTEFKKRGSLLIDQFKAIGHNGELTLGENIGDLVGLTASYRAAYRTSDLANTAQSVADSATIKQRKKDFFLQYARVWCEVERPSYTELRLKTDPHSLGYARTNEQVKQNPAFQEAYGCKDSNLMVLPNEKRAKIWW